MKRMIDLWLLAFAVTVYFGAPALAQHGHGMGSSMSHSASHATSSSKSGEHSMTQKLTNTKLGDKVSQLTGMSATSACQGFKNLGQCVAAAHVAKNLNIPGGFMALKDKMLGTSTNGTSTSPSKPMSLGKAIQALDPSANVKTETKKAKQQADQDVKDSEASS